MYFTLIAYTIVCGLVWFRTKRTDPDRDHLIAFIVLVTYPTVAGHILR